MPIARPPQGRIAPDLLAEHQGQQTIAPEDAALNQRLQALPEYQAYLRAYTQGNLGAIDQTRTALTARLEQEDIPATTIFDPFTAQFRQKNWNERNSNWSALLYSGAAVGAGLGGAAAAGAFGAGAGAGTGAGVGLGETAATTGLAAGGAGLPGLVAAPTVASLSSLAPAGAAAASGPAASSVAPAAASSVAPAVGVPPALAANAPATGGAMSVINGLTGGNPYGTLISAGLGALQAYQGSQAAQTASEQEIAAANRALELQGRMYDTSRGDYLENRDYTRQQIAGLAPYQQIGAGALGNLYQLTGQPRPASLASYQPPAGMPPPAQPPVQSVMGTPAVDPRRPPTAGTPTGQVAQPRTVLMAAPDGSQRPVPMDQVARFEAAGARRI